MVEPRMDKDVVSLWIGWLSTLTLLATLLAQIVRQWKMGKADEVSPALFIGQCAASVGFIIYSALVGSVVFIVSNALILVIALGGEVVRRILQRRTS
jgi:MtN3 and saliva related transmembrane protein